MPAGTRCIQPGAQGPTFDYKEEDGEQKVPLAGQEGARQVPLHIPGSVHPATKGQLIHTHYWCDVELDVPWGGDVNLELPFAIYAPQSPQCM